MRFPMMRVVQRLLYLALVLWGTTIGTYALFALAPGDPAEIILRQSHETPGQPQIEALRSKMGLDAPWHIRYLRWLKAICMGDWGVSWQSGLPVWDQIRPRFQATLELALGAFLLVLAISIFSGVCAALCHNRAPDRLIRFATVVLTAVPSYWLALLLIYFFSLKVPVFPVSGRGGPAHLMLPAVTLGLSVAVLQGRVLRATLIQILAMDYIRFAVAKGLGPVRVFTGHVVRNALPSMVVLWGVSLGQLLGGAVIVESIFAWPGLGLLTVEAVMARDIPVVQAVVLLTAAVFVWVNQLADLLHYRLDPKVGLNR